MNTKGQVTLFIIIGIILLIMIGLFIYVLKPDTLSRNDILIDDVPEQYSPVQNYVHSCMQIVSREAVEILGERGGYLVSSEYLYTPESLGLTPSYDNPSQHDSFYLHPAKKLPVPYWFYVEGYNDGFATKKPILRSEYDEGSLRVGDRSIEAQIDKYVQLEVTRCLNDFSVFEDRNIAVNALESAPIVTTYVRDDDVAVNMKYPIEVTIGDEKRQIENFGIELPVRLEDVYLLAEKISQAQADYHFLENFLQTQLAISGQVESAELPPVNDFRFNFGSGNPHIWDILEVKDYVKFLLSYSTLLQVQGSSNYRLIQLIPGQDFYHTRQRVYQNLVLPFNDYFSEDELEELNLENTNVLFNYFDNWDIYFTANDKFSGQIEPQLLGVQFSILNFGFEKYVTYFDVSWPVLVSLEEETSFNGEGYTFNIGLEGNLRDNEPINSTYKIPEEGTPITSLCQSKDQNISIQVFSDDCDDNLENCEPVESASVTLLIAESACSLGVTDENGRVNASVPEGVLDGWIRTSKEGYLDEKVQYLPRYNEYTINGMRKKYPYTFSIKKLSLSGNELSEPLELNENDTAVVTMERIDLEGDDGDLFLILDFEDGEAEAEIAEGSYEIDAKLFTESPQFSADYIESLNEFEEIAPEEAEELRERTIGAMSQNTTIAKPSGGVFFGFIDDNDPGNYVTFLRSQVKSGDEIELYVVEMKDLNLTNPEDLERFNIRELTRTYQDDLIPVIR